MGSVILVAGWAVLLAAVIIGGPLLSIWLVGRSRWRSGPADLHRAGEAGSGPGWDDAHVRRAIWDLFDQTVGRW